MADFSATSEQNQTDPSSTSGETSASTMTEEQQLLIDLLAHYRGEKLPQERLEKVVKFAQKQLREREAEELRQREESLADQLNPYEKRIAGIEERIHIVADEYDDRIEALRTEKRASIEKIRQEIAAILKEYNPFRENLGLRPRTMYSGSRKRGEKKHKYDYEFKDENTLTLIIDGKIRENIDISNRVRVRMITEIFDRNNIKDETGGRARGVVTQIKVRRAKILSAAKHEETIESINQ